MWLQHLVRERVLELGTVATEENRSDMGTKGVPRERLLKLLRSAGLLLVLQHGATAVDAQLHRVRAVAVETALVAVVHEGASRAKLWGGSVELAAGLGFAIVWLLLGVALAAWLLEAACSRRRVVRVERERPPATWWRQEVPGPLAE